MSIKNKLCICLFLFCSLCYAESEGELAFKSNNPAEAVILLETEIQNGTASSSAYNYLGLGYMQLGDYSKAVQTFERGLSASGTNKKILAFNQGNAYYALKDYTKAVSSYSLALSADSGYFDALLNRANSYLMCSKFDMALTDYKRYVLVVPADPQKDSILQLISALEGEIENQKIAAEKAEKEAARLAEEEKRMRQEMEKRAEEERERIAAEEAERKRVEDERKAAEAERRRKLLEEVANSLQNTDSTNMSAGAEDLMDYDQEAELD